MPLFASEGPGSDRTPRAHKSPRQLFLLHSIIISRHINEGAGIDISAMAKSFDSFGNNMTWRAASKVIGATEASKIANQIVTVAMGLG